MKNAKLVPSTLEFYSDLTGPNPHILCDFCRQPISRVMVDGKTEAGPWALMCLECHFNNGCGLGTGKGQRYEYQADSGRWAKMIPASEAKPTKSRKPPSLATLERWSNDGVAKAVDGCRVEPDGICEHGSPSWLLKLGVI